MLKLFILTTLLLSPTLTGCIPKKNNSGLKGKDLQRRSAIIQGPELASDWVPRIGMGYNASTQEVAPLECIHYGDLSTSGLRNATDQDLRDHGVDPTKQGFKFVGGNVDANIAIAQDLNYEDLTKELTGHLNGSVMINGVTVTGSFDLNNKHVADEFSATQSIYGNYILGVEQFSNPTNQVLTSAGKDIQQLNTGKTNNDVNEAVIAKCGDHIVSQIAYGASFIATIKVTSGSKSDAQRVAGSLGIKFATGNIDANAELKKNQNSQNTTIEISIKQKGGQPVLANTAITSEIAHCDVKNIPACKNGFEAVYKYFSEEFPKQFYDSEGKLIPDRLHILAARTLPITEDNLKTLAGVKTDIPCNDLLCETEVGLMNDVIKALNEQYMTMRMLRNRGQHLLAKRLISSGSNIFSEFMVSFNNAEKQTDIFGEALRNCLKERDPERCIAFKVKAVADTSAFPVNKGLFTGEIANLEAYCQLYKDDTNGFWFDESEDRTIKQLGKIAGAGEMKAANCKTFSAFYDAKVDIEISEDHQIETLRPFELMPNLKFLKLINQKKLASGHDARGQTAKGFTGIVAIPKLETLTVLGGGFTNIRPLEGLGKLKELKLLNLSDINPEDMRKLSLGLRTLKVIDFSQTRTTETAEQPGLKSEGYACSFLKNVKSLQRFHAQGVQFGAQDFSGCENTKHDDFKSLQVFDHFKAKMPLNFTNWCPAEVCRA